MTESESLLKEYSELQERLNELRKEFSNKLSNIIQNELTKFDELVAIRWEQYTPHFNDGDACVFSKHDTRFRFKDTDDEDGDYEDGFLSSYDLNYEWDSNYKTKTFKDEKSKRLGKIMEHFDNFMAPFDDNLLLETYEDHSQVTVTREKVDVEEYSHD